jgi:hypothetical protein
MAGRPRTRVEAGDDGVLAMNQERPSPEDVPSSDGIEVLRDQNGTGDGADEEQLGVTKEEVKDLANDAEGG